MSEAGQTRKDGFRPDIERMRGIAVLLVVLFHSRVPGFSGGFIGGDVFFALSGYLITGIILNEIAQRGKLSFRNFYARRARRLLPAAGLVVVFTLLLILFMYSPLELAKYAKWGSYTYASNYMFLRDVSNYFASDVSTNPYLHAWSLAVEEQFYLFWPGLITLTLIATKARRHLAMVLVVMSAVSLAMCIWLTYYRAPWALFSLPTRAWEFGLGGLGFMLPTELLVRRKNLVTAIGWLGFLAVVAGAFLFTPQTAFPGFSALLPVLGTIAILLAWFSGAAVSGLNNTRIVDLTDQFCSNQTCPTLIEGHVAFRDGGHLTSSFSRSLAPVLKHEMVETGNVMSEHLSVAGVAH